MHNDAETAGEYVSRLLHLPKRLEVESIIAVGYSDEQKPGHKKEDLPSDRIHRNVYGKK